MSKQGSIFFRDPSCSGNESHRSWQLRELPFVCAAELFFLELPNPAQLRMLMQSKIVESTVLVLPQ